MIPSTLPADTNAQSLRSWQQAGGAFNVKAYKITIGPLLSEGAGKFALDEDLQPDAQLESKVRGYEAYIQTLLQADKIEPLHAMAITALINTQAKPDPVTSENVAILNIKVKNQTLSMGPLQAPPLPRIEWPGTHSPPDQHQ